ncbi:hypothetical protein KGQ20_05050 [Catenulispora sp. NF23]|uniref:Uncharacterized protein n=1 Tax=Catenulispora pinistramenti TaxID=2705254 RepID=A0ABS5KMB5_9ACTN|nr:hypothetical protein [Catenulispora pinistramenti]MBS2532133.1 hypothetical protein [Catenulispora pinistramenti]MBS2547175.1 hypothetical protein [Catenulispora pinistramenti]
MEYAQHDSPAAGPGAVLVAEPGDDREARARVGRYYELDDIQHGRSPAPAARRSTNGEEGVA